MRDRLSLLFLTCGGGIGLALSGCGGSGGSTTTASPPSAGVHRVQVLATFDGGVNGGHPSGAMALDTAGNLYGATTSGGANGHGTIFELKAGSTTVTTLASLSDDRVLSSLVADGSGNLFGVLQTGSDPTTASAIIKLAKGSGQVSTIASYPYQSTTPQIRIAVDTSGNLYGTLKLTGGDAGTVFEVASGSLALTPLATAGDLPGKQVLSSVLVLDGEGNVFGTTYARDGEYDTSALGTVWEINGSTKAWKTLGSFATSSHMEPPSPGGLIIDSAGNLYGVTLKSDSSVYGALYKLSRQGEDYSAPVTLVTFKDFPVLTPTPQIAIDSAGNLFGTGLEDGNAAVYEVLNGSSTPTVLAHSQKLETAFQYSDRPDSPLLLDGAGDVFDTTGVGATPPGSDNLSGVTVLEVAKGSGVVTELGNGTGADALSAGPNLILGNNDVVYGNSSSSKANANGSLFALPPPDSSGRAVNRYTAR